MGPDGPPLEAYSRVTRDLPTIFDGLHEAVDERVIELARTFDAVTRRLSDDEVARFRIPLQRSLAVVPPDLTASPLPIGWTDLPGSGDRWWRLGWALAWTDLECDACDADLGGTLIEFDDVVAGVTGGFREWVSSGMRVKVGYEMASSAGGTSYSWQDAKRDGRPRGWQVRRWVPWQPGIGPRRDVGSAA